LATLIPLRNSRLHDNARAAAASLFRTWSSCRNSTCGASRYGWPPGWNHLGKFKPEWLLLGLDVLLAAAGVFELSASVMELKIGQRDAKISFTYIS
jgi:hypothetical protein